MVTYIAFFFFNLLSQVGIPTMDTPHLKLIKLFMFIFPYYDLSCFGINNINAGFIACFEKLSTFSNPRTFCIRLIFFYDFFLELSNKVFFYNKYNLLHRYILRSSTFFSEHFYFIHFFKFFFFVYYVLLLSI